MLPFFACETFEAFGEVETNDRPYLREIKRRFLATLIKYLLYFSSASESICLAVNKRWLPCTKKKGLTLRVEWKVSLISLVK